MNIEKKLLFYIFLIPIVGMLVGMTGGMYLINYSSSLSQKEGETFLKKREIELQKDRLKIIVNSVINNIKVLKKNDPNLINHLKNLYPPQKDKYIFIYKVYNLKGGEKFAKMLFNANRPDLEGKLLDSKYKDNNGFAFREKMLSLINKQGECFVTYNYIKPHTNKIIPKISYFKYYPPLHLIIASGIYLDDINKIIQHYQEHLENFNIKIIEKFILISIIIFVITLFFTYLISKNLISEFKKYRRTISLNEKKLRYKLYLDELTNLKSRKALIEDIEKNRFDCFILIDIDNFRSVNQFFGADIGDKYLKEFAKLLKQFRREVENTFILYRIGSDEFGMGILHSTHEKTFEIAQKLDKFLSFSQIKIESEEFDCNATIVFSNFPNPLKKTLLTLTQAKYENKSILSYKDIEHENREQEFFETKKMLKNAIANDQIQPFAQPILNNKRKIIKYELLMRIVTKDRVIPPYFLEDAKRAKLYNKISSIMIKKCFEFIKTTNILCSINIDMQDINNQQMINQLKEYVKEVNKPVVFEILESESFKNYKELKKFIKEFKQYGVLFAIDDFGSGYSNYSEILELKPDYLKIDGSLIKNILSSKENLILIDSILFLTHMIGIKTTAEFVENEAIFHKLKTLGINEFQGYYFSKPKPISEL